jgi:type VI protein secretion system component VasK
MQGSKLFSVECPQCRAAVPFLRVKPRFACKACSAPLMSNRSSVDVWAVLIYVALAPVIWIASDNFPQAGGWPSALWIGIGSSWLFAAAFYCLLAPRALRLEPDTWNAEDPASPAARKP